MSPTGTLLVIADITKNKAANEEEFKALIEGDWEQVEYVQFSRYPKKGSWTPKIVEEHGLKPIRSALFLRKLIFLEIGEGFVTRFRIS